jgi:zinc protease
VKNERRQSYENAPYGIGPRMSSCLSEGSPVSLAVIGYMDDLTAASYEDVVEFFKKYYAPANASLVVAGDIDPRGARASSTGSRREAGTRTD